MFTAMKTSNLGKMRALFEDLATGDNEDVTVVLSNVTPYSRVDRYRRFIGTWCFNI
jgi:hypothetical protein